MPETGKGFSGSGNKVEKESPVRQLRVLGAASYVWGQRVFLGRQRGPHGAEEPERN